MKRLTLMFALLGSSAVATQESQMRFTAPQGTASDYKSETTTEIKNTLVSLKSLDGKGVPQGLKDFVLENFSSKTLPNAEYRETVLEQDENIGATLQITGWNRSSTGLSMGPRIQLEYTVQISNRNKAEARDIKTFLDHKTVPQGLPASAEKVMLESQKASAAYSALTLQTLMQPFELRKPKAFLATPIELGQKSGANSAKIKLGVAKLLKRTQGGGFRFALDVDTARYAPELLGNVDSSYRVKQYSRQALEYGPDGRLLRSSGTTTGVLQRSPETRAFQGHKFEVVTALVTASSTTTVRSDADDKTP